MPKVQFLAYRYLTDADFFNIYKPSGTESAGGGQTYIDFPVHNISVNEWETFFQNVNGLAISKRSKGNCWTFPIHSIGINGNKQDLVIYQRRDQSISISSQNINTRSSNRVAAWLPSNGFPSPANPNQRHAVPKGLGIFLVRTDANDVFAGWFGPTHKLAISITKNIANPSKLFSIESASHQAGDASMLDLTSEQIYVDSSTGVFSGTISPTPVATPVTPSAAPSAATPTLIKKSVPPKTKSEAELVDSLFSEDEDTEAQNTPEAKTKVQNIRERNVKVVAELKQLYDNSCQITGNKYTFLKKDGTKYSEVHHLIPLGDGGADEPINLVVLSPLLHRMLHYADVDEIDLLKVQPQQDGRATLAIKINGESFTITWHKEHAKLFQKT